MEIILQSPNDTAFYIFGFPIYFYGIILAIAIFIAVYCADWLYKKYYGFDSKVFDISPWLIIFGILGARLYYCLVNYQYYLAHPLEILNIRQGGLSIHGMIIIGIITLFVFSKVYKTAFLKLADVFLCSCALAQSIGRWGNFFNNEAFGLPSNLPVKLFIPVANRPIEFINYEYFHPTFLYESFMDFCIFIVLLFLFKKFSKFPGLIACIYLILYSLCRIFVEQIRIDSTMNINGFAIAQIMSVCLIIIALISSALIVKKG